MKLPQRSQRSNIMAGFNGHAASMYVCMRKVCVLGRYKQKTDRRTKGSMLEQIDTDVRQEQTCAWPEGTWMFSHRQVTAPANKFRQTHTSQNMIWTAQAQTHKTFKYDLMRTGWFSPLWFFIWLKGRGILRGNNLAILNRVWITIVDTWITYSTCKILNCLQRSFDLVCKCLSFKKAFLNLLQDEHWGEFKSCYWEILPSLWLKRSRFKVLVL